MHTVRGDLSVLGWVTTVAYLLAAVVAGAAAAKERAGGRRRLALFWAMSAAGLLALGVNDQLDLQIDAMRAGKALATHLGLYPDHRRALITAVGVASLLGLSSVVGATAFALRGHMRATWLAASGWVAIAAYVALRAALFHHLDELGLGFVRWGSVVLLELGGILALAYSALRVRLAAAPEPA